MALGPGNYSDSMASRKTSDRELTGSQRAETANLRYAANGPVANPSLCGVSPWEYQNAVHLYRFAAP
jgi:hypothetical protein